MATPTLLRSLAVTLAVTIWTVGLLAFAYPILRRTCLAVATAALHSKSRLAMFVVAGGVYFLMSGVGSPDSEVVNITRDVPRLARTARSRRLEPRVAGRRFMSPRPWVKASGAQPPRRAEGGGERADVDAHDVPPAGRILNVPPARVDTRRADGPRGGERDRTPRSGGPRHLPRFHGTARCCTGTGRVKVNRLPGRRFRG